MHSGSGMLQNYLKHHLGLMEAIRCVRAKTFIGTSVSRNSASVYRNTPVSHRFACIRVAKCSKTLQNIILGLMEAIGCVRVKTFVRSSVPRNSALVETHQFLIVLHAFA